MGGAGVKGKTAEVFSMDYEGRGVARVAGKTIFIKGAIPSETVGYKIIKTKKQFDEAEAESVLVPSGERVVPKCGYFETCGGCVLQHVSHSAQVAFKQRILEEQLLRIGKIKAQRILPPIYGRPWGYRDRARLSVSTDKGRLKVGFKARKTDSVVDVDYCDVLPQELSEKIPKIKILARTLSDKGEKLKFVELFKSKSGLALNLAFSERPSESVLKIIKDWFEKFFGGGKQGWQLWIQGGSDNSVLFSPETDEVRLSYDLPDFGIVMPYQPGDFTQINADINGLMVSRALHLLDIRSGERIADLFCGLGNFSLPMAKYGVEVLAIEGDDALVGRGRENARENGCSANIDFIRADLFEVDEKTIESWGAFDKMLLDPPRSGAYAVVKALHPPYLPAKIVYVSCNPATLARDAAVLAEKGYVLRSAGVINMFPQTAHVESVAVFDLQEMSA